MDIKLTTAQKKLVEALKANPGTDALEHLNHIRNQTIADEMIGKLLKFGVLCINSVTGIRELNPEYKTDVGQFIKTETANDIVLNSEEKLNVSLVPTKKLSKKAMILKMLYNKARLDDMREMTGWEEKSIRCVISQLKKEKKLAVFLEKGKNGESIYYAVE